MKNNIQNTEIKGLFSFINISLFLGLLSGVLIGSYVGSNMHLLVICSDYGGAIDFTSCVLEKDPKGIASIAVMLLAFAFFAYHCNKNIFPEIKRRCQKVR